MGNELAPFFSSRFRLLLLVSLVSHSRLPCASPCSSSVRVCSFSLLLHSSFKSFTPHLSMLSPPLPSFPPCLAFPLPLVFSWSPAPSSDLGVIAAARCRKRRSRHGRSLVAVANSTQPVSEEQQVSGAPNEGKGSRRGWSPKWRRLPRPVPQRSLSHAQANRPHDLGTRCEQAKETLAIARRQLALSSKRSAEKGNVAQS